MLSLRILPFALLLASPCLAAQEGSALSRPGTPSASTMQQAPAEPQASRQLNLIGFVALNASAAGALEACEAPSSLALRNCVEGIIPNWSSFTGQPQTDPETVAAIPVIWKDAFERANAVQKSSRPLSCDQVVANAKQMSVWKICTAPWR